MKKENENATINEVVTKEQEIVTNVIKKEITYAEASAYMKNRISHKEYKKEFATLNGARWMLLQEVGRMSNTATPFTYTVDEAKKIIDNNKESIPATKTGKFTVNCLIAFINKAIKEKAKQEKEEAKKDLLSSRITKKKEKSLYSQGGLI